MIYSRKFVENCLFKSGCFAQQYSLAVICVVFTIFTICCFGLQYVRIETDIVKLWVSGSLKNNILNNSDTFKY